MNVKRFIKIFIAVFLITPLLDLSVLMIRAEVREYKRENFETGRITYKGFTLPTEDDNEIRMSNPYCHPEITYFFDIESDEGYTRLVNVDKTTYYKYDKGDEFNIPKN